jgi:hypothetical protein
LQRELAQTDMPFAGAVHLASQPPQLSVSLLTTTQPLAQTVCPWVQPDGAPGRMQMFVSESHTYPAAQRPCASHVLPSRLFGNVDWQPHAMNSPTSTSDTTARAARAARASCLLLKANEPCPRIGAA